MSSNVNFISKSVANRENILAHEMDFHANGYSSDSQSAGSQDNSPAFLLEHLATFTVSAQSGMMYPADGMRRLLQMEKNSGIWTQKMLLKLEPKFVIILDYENEAIVEKFPVQLIREPTSFTSTDPLELYNNILIFIVDEDMSGKSLNPSEMHIFQCVRVNAKAIVEEMNLYLSGKASKSSNYHKSGLPPPPNNPPPGPPVHVKDHVNMFNATAAHGSPRRYNEERRGGYHDNAKELSDDGSSAESDSKAKAVPILNHCFDDIERFVPWIQNCIAAQKELEKRRKSRKSKKKDLGDGMLSVRARPPSEESFIDVFQKSKLSLNLLAKLKNKIKNPNAPEFVHFLFTPLAIIVDAAYALYGNANIVQRVVSPLLTRDAVELLQNCLTSKEHELWESFGEAWTTPSDKWKRPVEPYQPTFSDGWKPDYPFEEELRGKAAAMGAYVAMEAKRRENMKVGDKPDDFFFDEKDRIQGRGLKGPRVDKKEVYRESSHSPPTSYRNMDPAARSDISADSIEHISQRAYDYDRHELEKQQMKWLEELKAGGGKIVQVVHPHTASNYKELTVIRGEYLEVLDDSRKWWKVKNYIGEVGYVSYNMVAIVLDGGDHPNPLYEHNEKHNPGARHARGPSQELEYPHPVILAPASADWVQKERKEEYPTIPVPPPPGKIEKNPTPFQKEVLKGRNKEKYENVQDQITDELKSVFRNKFNQRPLPIQKTPEAYINLKSSEAEVQDWLKVKGFSVSICHGLQNTSGKEILSLEKDECIRHFGQHEGSRLASQLNLCRSVSKFNTSKSEEVEFREKLEIRKKKAENPDSEISEQFNYLLD